VHPDLDPRSARGQASDPGPVLGLDLGDARIGVAISDPERRLAVPVGTVHVGQPPGELVAIAGLVRERGATLIVVGLPLSLRGEQGARAGHAGSFADALRSVVEVPVELHDERLSTVEAGARDRGYPRPRAPPRRRRHRRSCDPPGLARRSTAQRLTRGRPVSSRSCRRTRACRGSEAAIPVAFPS
jgi:putative transcription antitermination factor YqgF